MGPRARVRFQQTQGKAYFGTYPGAVLSQSQDGQGVVLAYASRTLSNTERNYEVSRRELLAVVYWLKVYRQYLLVRKFVIRTDHSALQSLRRTPEPIGQQARWQAFIEQLDFEIHARICITVNVTIRLH